MTMYMEDDFSFDPLPDRADAIRLIEVLSPNGSGYIRCKLADSHLDRDDYIALSYVWGSDSAAYEIRVNGEAYWVRSNLFSFLYDAQINYVDHRFWIDALCIDQKSDAEKSRQIPLMAQIFSKATFVLAWLDSAFPRGHHVTNANAQAVLILAESIRTADAAAVHKDTVLGALKRLMHHEYWSRVWVVQEILLATKVTLAYENGQFEFADFLNYLELIQPDSFCGRLSIVPYVGHEGPVGDVYEHYMQGKSANKNSTTFAPLFELVIRYSNHRCSQERDHVFGLLGLASDASSFRMNYSDSPYAVLTNVLLTAKTYTGPTAAQYGSIANALGIKKEFHFQYLGHLDEDHMSYDASRERYRFQLCETCRQPWFCNKSKTDRLKPNRPHVILFGLPEINVYYLGGWNHKPRSGTSVRGYAARIEFLAPRAGLHQAVVGLVHMVPTALSAHSSFDFTSEPYRERGIALRPSRPIEDVVLEFLRLASYTEDRGNAVCGGISNDAKEQAQIDDLMYGDRLKTLSWNQNWTLSDAARKHGLRVKDIIRHECIFRSMDNVKSKRMQELAVAISSASTLEEVASAIVEAITKHITNFFMMDKDYVDGTQPLIAYGIDSLSAVEIRNMLATQAQAEVSVFEIMQAESLNSLGSMSAARSSYISAALT